jgi:hypothetical protein
MKFKDRTGIRYGRLIAKTRIKTNYWQCLCDCGIEVTVFTGSLDSGATKSCGCLRRELRSGFVDLTGLKFGRLTAIEESPPTASGKVKWLCVCTCGKEVRVQATCLKTGHTKSCGCLKATDPSQHRHGHAAHLEGRSPTYMSWLSLRRRSNKLGVIPFDPAWSSFEVFLQDMGERPDGMTLDRKDNAKGYSKSNCKWSGFTEQVRNRTNTVFLTVNGITKPVAQWAEEAGLKYHTLTFRLKRGWTPEKALSTPVGSF